MRRLRYLAFVLVALAAVAPAQEKSPRLTFDVASIRPSDPARRSGMIRPLPGGYGYTSQNIPVKLIISLMYRVPMRQIKGGPDWLNSQAFDIEAKADKAYSVDDLHTMFQNLLADRFNLKFHMEPKEGPVYALTVDPGGLKMTPNLTPQDFNIPVNQGAGGAFIGKRVPMPYLCWFLGQQLQSDERPVVDKTGLSGNYDFSLLFLPQLPPGMTKDSLPPEMQDRPTVFEALRQQLGLRLQAERGTVQYLVIDSIDRPSDN